MSGIAGVILVDRQRPVPSDLAERQAHSLGQRGPDGRASWMDRNVYLCHAHRDTTGFRENNLDQADTRLMVVADIRLDNRADLADELGIADVQSTSDVALLSHAYLRWAENCCDHLYGDFAFAIWDRIDNTLFCARDQLGVKPLFYAKFADRLLFSSELAGLVPSEAKIEDARMAGFLLGFSVEPALTVFKDVHRLPPGHCLVFSDGKLTIRRYWSLPSKADQSERPAAEVFRERLDDAVAARLRGSPALGAMLSGGLDSSSIVSLAVRQLGANPNRQLQTYSFDYPATPELDEREYVQAVLDVYAVRPNFVGFDGLAPLQGLERLADGQSDLLFAPGLPKMIRLFAAAKGSGTQILLDGHGGDEVVSHGFGRFSELAKGGHWFGLYRELKGAAGLFGESPNRLFLKYFTRYGPGQRLQRFMRQMRATGLASATPASAMAVSFLDPVFAARSDAGARHLAWQDRLRQAHASQASLHVWNLSTPQVGEAFEALDRAATASNIELRFPFYDRRVVSFAVGVSSNEILQGGWTRSLLRRSMQGILPPKVQWRRDKVDFSSEIRLGLVRHHAGILADLSRGDSPIAAYVDTARLRSAITRLIERPAALESAELFIIWRSAFLSLWLKGRGA